MIRRTIVAAKKLLGMEVRPGDAERDPKWEKLSRAFLVGKECVACGGKDHLQTHHRIPFHVRPDLELDESNWIPLCVKGPGGMNCHLVVGHCGDWRDYNPKVQTDAEHIREMLAARIQA